MSAQTADRPRWVDVVLLADLDVLSHLVHEAIISIHRINAINTTDGKIRPWTEEQFEFVEQTRLVPIAKQTRIVAPRIQE